MAGPEAGQEMTRVKPFSGCQPVEAIQARKTLKTAQDIDPLGAGYPTATTTEATLHRSMIVA